MRPINFISDRKYRWMSNFAGSPFKYKGVEFKTVEHAFQYMKTNSSKWKKMIKDASTPGEAKRLGRACEMRDDWEDVKADVMLELVRAKFTQNPSLKKKLLVTGGAAIREDSPWDGYWGTGSNGKGKNMMGKILSQIRRDLQKEVRRCQSKV